MTNLSDIVESGGNTVVYPSGASLGGTIDGNVIVKSGTLTLTSSLAVNGFLTVVTGAVIGHGKSLTVRGDLIAGGGIDLSSDTEGQNGGSLTVEGNLIAAYGGSSQTINLKGIDTTGTATQSNSGSLTCNGNVRASTISAYGGSNTAGNAGIGGAVDVGGNCLLGGYIYCYGGSATGGNGNGGYSGYVSIRGNLLTYGISAYGGAGGNLTTGGNGGNGGAVVVEGEIISGNAIGSNINIDGGHAGGSDNNNGGNSGSFACKGIVNLGAGDFTSRGGNATGSGVQGSPQNALFYGGCIIDSFQFTGLVSGTRYVSFRGDCLIRNLNIATGFQIRSQTSNITRLYVRTFSAEKDLRNGSGIVVITGAKNETLYIDNGSSWREYVEGKTTVFPNGSSISLTSIFGNVICSGAVSTDSSLSLYGNLTSNGILTLNGNLTVYGDLISNSNIITQGYSLTVWGNLSASSIDTTKSGSNGGAIYISGNLLARSIINTSGASGFSGGTVDCYGEIIAIGGINTIGGAGNGNGGSIFCRGGDLITSGSITTYGGTNPSGAAGYGGDIECKGSLICSNPIDTKGGLASGADGNGGHGGSITIRGDCIATAGINAYGGNGPSGYNGDGGYGGNINISGKLQCDVSSISTYGGNGQGTGNGNFGGSITARGFVTASYVSTKGGTGTVANEAGNITFKDGCNVQSVNLTGLDSSERSIKIKGDCYIGSLTLASTNYKIRAINYHSTKLFVGSWAGNTNLYDENTSTVQLVGTAKIDYFYEGYANAWSKRIFDAWNTKIIVAAAGGGTVSPSANRDEIFTDTTTNAAVMAINLPFGPSIGMRVKVIDGRNDWAVHNVTINRNSQNIDGAAANFTCNTSGGWVEFVYVDATFGWKSIT